MPTNKPIPTEDEIADLLSRVQPQPGLRFHEKMNQQTWNQDSHAPLRTTLKLSRVAAALGMIVLLVLGISIFSPSFDTFAQRISQFFFPSESETITTHIDPREISHPLERFNLSMAEAENLAGFPLKIPATLPAVFEFTGAAYDETRQAAILNYVTSDSQLVLRISQQPLGSSYQSISPAAQIESVEIGSFTGEYVAGGWMIPVPEVKSGFDDHAIASTQAVWDPTVYLQTLRWADGAILFEIMFAGDPEHPEHLDKDELIAIATRLQ